ncbi:hypothetical protein BDW22DRAFT_1353881 [Trametopsis cervina]|nr:hypothetical protein BDW22DRAFT_1353881 [Trametopsis cervina]
MPAITLNNGLRLSVRQGGSDPAEQQPPAPPPFASPSPPPPPPEQNNSGGGLPKIGGSSGGFIALVVALSCIILFSCIGIFVLIRRQEDDPFEAHARSVTAGKRLDTNYERPPASRGIREKLRGLFGTRKMKREGWLRANSNDDDTWAAAEDLIPRHTRAISHDIGVNDGDIRWSSDIAPSHQSSFRQGGPGSRSTLAHGRSLSSINTDLPGSEQPPFPNPFSSSPTSMYSREEISTSPPNPEGRNPEGNRSVTMFPNGTRFKESLDF